MTFYAHSSRHPDRSDWQTALSHLNGVGEKARILGDKVGCGAAAELGGKGHDLGKYTEEFDGRLSGSTASVDHSTAGAWHVLDGMKKGSDRLVAELVSYCIAGHHSGLPDYTGGASSLSERLARYVPKLHDDWKHEVTLCRTNLLPKFNFSGHDGKESQAFRFAMLGRYIFSCLVDADYRDTEAYYSGLEGQVVERDFPLLRTLLPMMISSFDEHVGRFPAPTNDVGAARAEILSVVLGKAKAPRGIFTMNVPTGGGKTLSTLGFALRHAQHHGMQRIIYGIPFTSIIDQTADIFSSILGKEHVLEHHSSMETPDGMLGSGQQKMRRAAEDWAVPVVVTTNVQFFESLMTSKPSKARKIHNIANSVIILDEAQTIPRHLLIPCVVMMDELTRNYGCTIVFCTATQPALDSRRFPKGHPLGLSLEGRELAPDPQAMARRLKRVEFVDAGILTNADIVEALRDVPQSLVIVNSRKHALDLYLRLRGEGLDGVIHLSTRQTAAHRKALLAEVRSKLKTGEPCRVVSTSVIEAGVDVDFPKVWRCQSGLDSIAQAGGRCNREGKRPLSESTVTIFSNPDYPPPREVNGSVQDMANATSIDSDLLSPEVIEKYFLEAYWRHRDEGLDREGILGLFKLSQAGADMSYRTGAERFKMIESDARAVIISHDEEARAALSLCGRTHVSSTVIARKLQAHVVQIPQKDFERLLKLKQIQYAEEVMRGDQFAFLSDPVIYTTETGLIWEAD